MIVATVWRRAGDGSQQASLPANTGIYGSLPTSENAAPEVGDTRSARRRNVGETSEKILSLMESSRNNTIFMASLSEHCEDCRRELGEDFKYVYEWLDALFKVLGPKHRSARHHAGGVEEVRKMWGDRAARAAEIHISKDYGGSVPSENEVQPWGLFGPPEQK